MIVASTTNSLVPKVFCVEITLPANYATSAQNLVGTVSVNGITQAAPLNKPSSLGITLNTILASTPGGGITVPTTDAAGNWSMAINPAPGSFAANGSLNNFSGNNAYIIGDFAGINANPVRIQFVASGSMTASFVVQVKNETKNPKYLAFTQNAVAAITSANTAVSNRFYWLQFPANPTFDFTGLLQLYTPVGNGTGFVYEIVNNNPVELKATWNAALGCYEGPGLNKLTSYVVSNVKLAGADPSSSSTSAPVTSSEPPVTSSSVVTSSSDTSKPNPGTGVNDMINVAITLAVISLAAVGAVSFKKISK